jgi:Carboxypeptidase regulatory-like domain/TonB dependent receptor
MSTAHFSFPILIRRSLSRQLSALFVILMASALQAQIVEVGTITGVVTDKSGALIPNAHVTVQNIGTGLTSNSTTDAQGNFVSPPLHPGDYNVVVEAPGFSKVVEHIRLEVGQRVSADVALTVGTNAETIEVQASGELLETESSSVSNLRTEQAVKDLPLNGRNFAELVGLGAGVVPAQTQLVSVPYTQQRGPTSYAFNGLRYQENRLLLDGIGDNENHNGLAVVIFPPIDAIQEFSEITADADARYGRGNGGTINLVFKSGTNNYHGEVFEFLRNDALNAKNYFATSGKPPLRQNEFGGTFGGPLFNRKNPKSFFFADYSGKRLAQGLTYVNTVPYFNLTSTGYDFSAYPAGSIKNPVTKVAYANNFIPLSDANINSTGANILNFYHQYAQPNIAGRTTANNFLYSPLLILNEDAFDVRVDHTFTERDSGFLRYSQARDSISQPGVLPNPLVGAVICGPAQNPAYQAVLSETHLLSPTTINAVRFGWSRFFVFAQNWNAGLGLPTQLGIPGVEKPGQPWSDGLPVYSFAGGTSIGDAGNSPTQIGTNNYQFDDNFNLVHGKHSLDVGVEFVRLQYNMFQTGAEHGSATFGTTYSGLAWTDLLFGAPKVGTYSFPSGTVGLRQSDLSLYLQDNYKVTSRLTLNLGIRYENFLGWPWTEVNNKLYNFLPSISTTTLLQVGSPGVPRSGTNNNNLNFAPRVGLAYSITPKTIFHAGFGLYYSAPNVTNSSGLSANVPVNDYWAFNNSNTYGAAATNGTPFNFASNGFVHTPVTSASALPLGLPVLAQDPNSKTPYSEQWHASIEQQIPYATVLRFAYVGTRGVHLDDLRDINAGSPGTTNVTVNRPYPYFAQINLLETSQVSNYNALQVTAERRAQGFTYLASYTYSHALDESTGSPGSVINPYDIRGGYGNSDLNVPNRFVASASYELPFKSSGKLNYFVQGWQLNTILNYFDGLPFSVSAASGVGDGLTPRAQLLPGFGNGSLPPGKRTLAKWFNTAAFANPAPGTWGNSGRNILEGPSTKTVDFSFFKNTHLTESTVLQLRAEFFNLFNTPQFNNPGATAGSSTIGTISSAASESTFQRIGRQVQLAAKIYF